MARILSNYRNVEPKMYHVGHFCSPFRYFDKFKSVRILSNYQNECISGHMTNPPSNGFCQNSLTAPYSKMIEPPLTSFFMNLSEFHDIANVCYKIDRGSSRSLVDNLIYGRYIMISQSSRSNHEHIFEHSTFRVLEQSSF